MVVIARLSVLRSYFLLRLSSVASRYMEDYISFYGDPIQKCDDNSVMSVSSSFL